MRTDLGMRKGKMIAQGAHAALGVILGLMRDHDPMDEDWYFKGLNKPEHMEKILELHPDTPLTEWINGSFTKVCVKCDSEEKLLDLYQEALDTKLPAVLITDNGRTEFNGVPTNTCIAIGPANAEDIDKITGELKLL